MTADERTRRGSAVNDGRERVVGEWGNGRARRVSHKEERACEGCALSLTVGDETRVARLGLLLQKDEVVREVGLDHVERLRTDEELTTRGARRGVTTRDEPGRGWLVGRGSGAWAEAEGQMCAY